MHAPAGTWDSVSIEHLRDGLEALVGILAVRLFPFAGCVAITRGYSSIVRACAVTGIALLSLLALNVSQTPVGWLVLGYAYYCGAGWVAFELLPYARSRAIWFGIGVALFWVLPLVSVRPTPMVFLSIGWEATLSSYSYGIDTRKKANRSLGDFLFFLLVNPVLVYRNRGSRVSTPSFNLAGALRVAVGAFLVLLSVGALEPLHERYTAQVSAPGGVAGIASMLLVGAVRLISEYAAQSGVASMQIGVMRQLGHSIPERFNHPLRARSPADFWRRWNIYVGDWARTYVFLPLMFGLSRRAAARRAPRAVAYGAATMVTFGFVGLLHDAFVVAASGRFEVPGSRWFLAVGAIGLGWEALAARVRTNDSSHGARAWLERALFLVAALYAAAHLWW